MALAAGHALAAHLIKQMAAGIALEANVPEAKRQKVRATALRINTAKANILAQRYKSIPISTLEGSSSNLHWSEPASVRWCLVDGLMPALDFFFASIIAMSDTPYYILTFFCASFLCFFSGKLSRMPVK